MCPADPFEEAKAAARGEIEVDERLCASRPTSSPRAVPSDSPLAAAFLAVEKGLDGDETVLVTPPYHIVRGLPAKKRGVKRRKAVCSKGNPHVMDIPSHVTIPLVDEHHVSPRQVRRGGEKGVPNGDLDLGY